MNYAFLLLHRTLVPFALWVLGLTCIVEVCKASNYYGGAFSSAFRPSHVGPYRVNRQKGLFMSTSSEQPLFQFGVLTDVQYADIDDGFSHSGKPRYYRDALNKLKVCGDIINTVGKGIRFFFGGRGCNTSVETFIQTFSPDERGEIIKTTLAS